MEQCIDCWHDRQYEYLPLVEVDFRDVGGITIALRHRPHEV
jgi:hypothetical protein